MASRPRPFVAILLAAVAGSASVCPSPPPSRLTEAQESTFNARLANIGASAVFTSVSPVFPSEPAQGSDRSLASSCTAGTRGPGLGVNATSGQPARNAAYAYSELTGNGAAPASSARSSPLARGQRRVLGCWRFGARHIDDDDPRQPVCLAEGEQIRLERLGRRPLGAVVAAHSRPDPLVDRRELAGQRLGQMVRNDAGGGQRLDPLRQRDGGDVVAAEDQPRQPRKTGGRDLG